MEKISLYIDNSKESKLAEKLLKENGIYFITKEGGKKAVINVVGYKGLFRASSAYPVFANSLKEPLIPSLFYEENGNKEAYLSFSGVKAYLRYILEDNFPQKELPWKNIETFYALNKKVTCFNENGDKIFEGPIDKAPHNFEHLLNRHDFSNWDKVGSRDLGNLEEIFAKANSKGIILDPEKHLVLFSEEINILKKGESIVLGDSRSFYEVSFSELYSNNGNLFRLIAHMLD